MDIQKVNYQDIVMKTKYTITEDNLHIVDSYLVSKHKFDDVYEAALVTNPYSHVWYRSKDSLNREWATHNLLYTLGLFRSHTKDVDINYPQKWYISLAYDVFGFFAYLIIK